MALLEIRNVTRQFGDFVAVNQVSLSIAAGEFFTLLGPSGCGKTTLLRMLAGFDCPNEGEIWLDGKNITHTPPEQRPLHTVFQSYALFPHMSVAENIAFPLKMAKVAPANIKARTLEVLEDVSLLGMEKRYPHELSGGQRQRVAIARALVNRPRVLLLDEPMAALDLQLTEQLQIELIKLQQEIGITFIYVTHDQGEALALSHRMAVMNKGQVAQLGEPSQVYEYPENRFVADFIGNCNLLDVTATRVDGEFLWLKAAQLSREIAAFNVQDTLQGQAGLLALRPEKVRIDSQLQATAEENHFRGIIHDTLYMGDVTVYRVEIAPNVQIQALLPNFAARSARIFEVGDPVEVAWRYDAGRFIHE